MDAKTILKLVDAGFSKAEIMKLAEPAAPDQVPDPKPEAPEVPTPAPEPKQPEQNPPAPAGVTMSDDQFRTLLQQLNIQGASIDIPPETDLTAKLGEHFKDLMIGK